MTCSLQIYRVRIGTFVPKVLRNSCNVSRAPNSTNSAVKWFLVTILTLYLSFIVGLGVLQLSKGSWNDSFCFVDNSCEEYTPLVDGPLSRNAESCNIDPRMQSSSITTLLCSPSFNFWLSRKQRNKLAKARNGNRQNRGIKLAHLNAGSAQLYNKMYEIEQVISEVHPHVLGISEANLKSDHDIQNVQLEEYDLITCKTLQNDQ